MPASLIQKVCYQFTKRAKQDFFENDDLYNLFTLAAPMIRDQEKFKGK